MTKLTSVHGLDIRNKNQLYLPIVHLSCFQKGVTSCALKIFSNLPNNTKNLRNHEVKFKIELHKCLSTHSLYSLTEFFDNNTSNVLNGCFLFLTFSCID
jgi:hypothetical protein